MHHPVRVLGADRKVLGVVVGDVLVRRAGDGVVVHEQRDRGCQRRDVGGPGPVLEREKLLDLGVAFQVLPQRELGQRLQLPRRLEQRALCSRA